MVKGMGYGIQHRQMSKTITNKKNEIYPTPVHFRKFY